MSKSRLKRYLSKALREPLYAFQVARMRTASLLTRLLPGGWSAPPETISLNLTHRCNLHCRMCGQWNPDVGSSLQACPSVITAELDLDVYEKLFREVRSFRPNITLFGGEPLLLAHFYDIVRAAKRSGLRVNMVSNMSAPTLDPLEIVRSGLDEIIFSLDGPREIHDRLRGVHGTFNRAVTNAMAIQQARKALKAPGPVINISSTLTRENVDYLEDVAQIAEFLQAGTLTFHHLIQLDKETYRQGVEVFRDRFDIVPQDFSGFILPPEVASVDCDSLIRALRGLRSRVWPFLLSVYPELTEEEIHRYYGAGEFVPDRYPHRCVSPWITVYVFPDGSVRPCLSTNYPAGNLKEQTFQEIWNGEPLKRYRRAIREDRAWPFCSKCTEMYRF